MIRTEKKNSTYRNFEMSTVLHTEYHKQTNKSKTNQFIADFI